MFDFQDSKFLQGSLGTKSTVVIGFRHSARRDPSSFVQFSLKEPNIVLIDSSFQKLVGFTDEQLQENGGYQVFQLILPEHMEKLKALYREITRFTINLLDMGKLSEHLLILCLQMKFPDKAPRWVTIEVVEHMIVHNSYCGALLKISDVSHAVIQARFSAYYYHCTDMRVVKDFTVESIRRKIELSERELLLFRLIRSGYREKEIAKYMKIKLSTVKSHKQNVFKKLGVSSSIEALNLIEGCLYQ